MKEHINLKNKTVLVTGSAGFIGSNLVMALMRTYSPIKIIGLDNVNDYYDPHLKEWRLKEVEKIASQHPNSTYRFVKGDLAERSTINEIFSS